MGEVGRGYSEQTALSETAALAVLPFPIQEGKTEIPVQISLRSVLIVTAIACGAIPFDLQACNVPVFRYAMERWPADRYQIVVYHRDVPPDTAFDILQKGLAKASGAANYTLESVDVTKPEGKAAAEQRSIVSYPWVEIYLPVQSQVRTPVWSGPLTLDRARTILNSPARTRLAQRLLSGDVAVWILIKSGHEQKDRRALDLLKTNLEQAAATLRIPDSGVDVNGNPIEVTDFKSYPVRFGLIEIARNDPREHLLVSALLATEPDLTRYDEPIAFPVFGRGRALYALVGGGIQERNIREGCNAMLAWCSCEIKAQTPGTDLLIAADWSRPFGGRMVKDPELPLTGVSAFLERQKPAESAVPTRTPGNAEQATLCMRVPASKPAQTPRPGGSPLVRNLLYLAGAAGVAVLALSVVLTAKAKR